MVVKAAFIILFAFCRSDENIAVPFVGEIPDIGNGNVHAFVFRALDERRKAIVVSSDMEELPMVFTAHRLQIVDTFSFILEGNGAKSLRHFNSFLLALSITTIL